MKIEVSYSPSDQEINDVLTGLLKFNNSNFSDSKDIPLSIFVKDDKEKIVGGLVGEIFTTTLFIRYLWISDSLRGQGFGTKLLQLAESESIKKGVKKLFLDTYTFQAPKFYEKYGFVEVGRYTDFPEENIDKVFFEKEINTK